MIESLFPQVIIRNKEHIAQAIHLHIEANKLCFIANPAISSYFISKLGDCLVIDFVELEDK
jgi:hypothetical protein